MGNNKRQDKLCDVLILGLFHSDDFKFETSADHPKTGTKMIITQDQMSKAHYKITIEKMKK